MGPGKGRWYWWWLIGILVSGGPYAVATEPSADKMLRPTAWGLLYSFSEETAEGAPSREKRADEYTAMLFSSLTYVLREQGFELSFRNRMKETSRSEGGTTTSLIEGLSLAQQTNTRWLFIVRTYTDASQFSWFLGVYDVSFGTLVASDSSFLFPGLSALPQIDEMVRRFVATWHQKQESVVSPREVVDYRQSFKGPQEQVRVYFGSALQGIEVGVLEGGRITAPYVPFEVGKPVLVTVEKEGYWSKELFLPKGITSQEFSLPSLHKITHDAWWFSTGLTRLMGAEVGRRWYPVPDRFFLSLSNTLWVNSVFKKGALPVFHTELRGELGAYLQGPVDSAWRFAVGLACAGIYTWVPGLADKVGGIDLCVEPLWVSLEYHFPRWAIFIKNRFPFSLGTGYLERGWLEIPNVGPQFWAVGVLLK
ncbi:MAG: hypothetical protein N2Z76_01745 [Treponemataceae bacterium]|nr:hypothetical protein [Treponemataceae bacterium]